jgi:TRAP-type C4-dicarboxylate transport system permease small subunit
VRVVVTTILLTLLAFVVSLFLAIVGILLVNMFRGGGINMAAAYRQIALPIAIVVLVVAFAATLITEVRHLRRLRAQTTSYRRAA